MLTEKEKPHIRTTTLLRELREGKKIVYKPLIVNNMAHDTITRFLIKEKDRLNERLKELRIIPQDRCKRETRDIRQSREQIICKEQLVEKLSVLKGEKLQPIKFIFENNKIKGFELVSFAKEEQRLWWGFLKQRDRMGEIIKIGEAYSDGPKLLAELFDIRRQMKFGSLKEVDQANIDFEIFTRKAIDIPTELDILFVPFFKMITEEFSD